MASKKRLEDLRADVAKQINYAQKKMSRLTENKGANFDKSPEYNPIPKADIRKYNEKQLLNAQKKLVAFNNRSYQLYGDAKGRILDPEKVKKYKSLEKQWNTRAVEEQNKYGKIPAFMMDGYRVEDVWKMRTSREGFVKSGSANVMLNVTERNINAFYSEKGLDTWINKLEDRLKPEFFDKKTKNDRETFHKFGESLKEYGKGLDEIIESIEDMDDYHFNLIFNDRNLMDTLGITYDIIKDTGGSDLTDTQTTFVENSKITARKLVKWAKTAKQTKSRKKK